MGTVAGLVRSARAVTLTGVGGVGKTRLALQTAAGIGDEFPGGVWMVELAPLVDGALVAATVASAIGAPVARGEPPLEAACRLLALRRALVVLDNCEHVIDDAAAVVDRLLEAAPRVRVLATSREPLNVAGEAVWRVPSLAVEVGDATGDAVALFAERAARVRPGFTLVDGTTRDAVVAVCRRLDGIPLAIELAAARARTMSVEHIAAHLDERFRLLTRGARTAVPRQQTLQGAIDWSYELLSPGERELFDALGVFAGGFDLAAVSTIAGVDEFEALDLVDSLAGKSMVEADAARDRYQLLETLRQYAWDHLVATARLAVVRDAHAAHYLSLAGEQARLMSVSGRQLGALDRLEADYDNLRAALAHMVSERRADDAARMLRRLIGLFNIRHPSEGFGWSEQVVAISEGLPPKARARLLGDAAFAAMNAGNWEGQVGYATQAIEVGGDDAPAIAHFLLGQECVYQDDCSQAVEHLRRAATIAAATNDLTTQASVAGELVIALVKLGDEEGARRLIPEGIELAERLGNPTITAAAYLLAGEGLALMGAPREAIAMFDKGLMYADQGGPLMASGLRVLYSLQLEDPVQAARVLRGALPVASDHLSGAFRTSPLVAAAKIATLVGRDELAARLLGAYLHSGYRGNASHGYWAERHANQLRHRLGTFAVDEELHRGGQLTAAQAFQLAADLVDATAGRDAATADPARSLPLDR
jgi:predicted ATPase